MAHTLPDYSTKYKTEKVFSKLDNAELAARLGSIDTFNRSGDVIWMDDFEAPINKWLRVSRSNPGTVALSAARCLRGSQSAKITTTAVAGATCEMRKRLQMPRMGSIGTEISFTTHGDGTYHMLWLDFYTGTTQYVVKAMYDENDKYLKIWKDSSAWQNIGTAIQRTQNDDCFHSMKIIFNLTTKKYTKLIFENQTFDISAYGIKEGGTAGIPHLDVYFGLKTDPAAATYCYADAFILTQNEI